MDSFSQVIEWLAANPWLAVGSFIVGVLGLILAVIFYIKSRRTKSPCYATRSFNIIRDFVSQIESLEIFYSGQRIGNLTATKIVFWNAGHDTIDSQDIAHADPLTVWVKEDYKILDPKILYVKTPANQFSYTLAEDKSHIAINFDYIDKNEGAVIQLLHTGKSDKDVEIRGTIKGAGKPILRSISTMEKKILSMFQSSRPVPIRERRKIIGIAFILTPIAVYVTLLLALLFPAQIQIVNSSTKANGSIISVIFIAIIATLPYLILGLNFLLGGVPKGFEEFEKDFEFERLD